MEKRLARGDVGINPLDAACKEHDIAYSKYSDSSNRYEADKKLQKQAMKRVFAKDSSFGERATAVGVAAAMKIKRSLTKSGKGLSKGRSDSRKKKKMISFPSLVKVAKDAIKNSKPDDIESAIKVAVATIKKRKAGKIVRKPRIIKIPDTYSGGVLPLVPIFAGLSALGTIAGSATSIINVIRQLKNAKTELEESKRHNKAMEAIAIGNKVGNGFYLRPNKSGGGFYLAPYTKNH